MFEQLADNPSISFFFAPNGGYLLVLCYPYNVPSSVPRSRLKVKRRDKGKGAVNTPPQGYILLKFFLDIVPSSHGT